MAILCSLRTARALWTVAALPQLLLMAAARATDDSSLLVARRARAACVWVSQLFVIEDHIIMLLLDDVESDRAKLEAIGRHESFEPDIVSNCVHELRMCLHGSYWQCRAACQLNICPKE